MIAKTSAPLSGAKPFAIMEISNRLPLPRGSTSALGRGHSRVQPRINN
jgi:hypothetical protein